MSFVDQLASGPSSVEIGRTPTVASRKCVATVRKESIPWSFFSSSTVDFRGLEGSDTKAENWSATGSRQIAEGDRELNHPVSENKGSLDVHSVCSNDVQSTPDRSTVRYATRGYPLRSPLLSAPCRDNYPPSRYDNPRQLHRLLHQTSFSESLLLGDGSAWHCVLCGRNP